MPVNPYPLEKVGYIPKDLYDDFQRNMNLYTQLGKPIPVYQFFDPQMDLTFKVSYSDPYNAIVTDQPFGATGGVNPLNIDAGGNYAPGVNITPEIDNAIIERCIRVFRAWDEGSNPDTLEPDKDLLYKFHADLWGAGSGLLNSEPEDVLSNYHQWVIRIYGAHPATNGGKTWRQLRENINQLSGGVPGAVPAPVTIPAPLNIPQTTISSGSAVDDLLAKVKSLELQIQNLKAGSGSLSGSGSNTNQLILNDRDIVKNALRLKIQQLSADFDNSLKDIGGKLKAMAYINPNWSPLEKKKAYIMMKLGSDELVTEVANELGVAKEEVSRATYMMLAAGASALMMIMTGGNFPLAAAAYYGVQAGIPVSGGKSDLFQGVIGDTGATYKGYDIKPMAVEIPEGLPNEIFAQYRFICYDRLSARWFPSDEIKPLEFESNEEYRWACLDRVGGKTYKANLIKKPRIYLQ